MREVKIMRGEFIKMNKNNKILLILFILFCSISNIFAVSLDSKSVTETSSVSRVVGDSAYDMFRQLGRQDIVVRDAALYANYLK